MKRNAIRLFPAAVMAVLVLAGQATVGGQALPSAPLRTTAAVSQDIRPWLWHSPHRWYGSHRLIESLRGYHARHLGFIPVTWEELPCFSRDVLSPRFIKILHREK